jgi:hypothetical protein
MSKIDEIYKGYEISNQVNEGGYFEAINTVDCDADIIVCKTVKEIKIEIDELN